LLSAEDFSVLAFTLRVAAISTLAILPLGIAAAWWLSRWPGAVRGIVDTVLSLPLVLPPTAVGLLLLEMLARGGPLGMLFARMGVQVVFTWKAVVMATAVMSFPLLVRPARAAFEEIDPRLIAVARTLGAGPFSSFARVAIPLAWRGIVAGTLLAFSRALGEFGATIMIAGNIPGRTQTLALAIFSRAELGDHAGALRLAGITALIAFVAVWIGEFATLRRRRRLAR